MAYKVLGQSAPSATTATTLYTVPSGKAVVASTLAVCNRGSVASYRVAVRPAGATLASEHYVAYDVALDPNAAQFITIGLTLAETDVVTVYASTANLSFSLFGDES